MNKEILVIVLIKLWRLRMAFVVLGSEGWGWLKDGPTALGPNFAWVYECVYMLCVLVLLI